MILAYLAVILTTIHFVAFAGFIAAILLNLESEEFWAYSYFGTGILTLFLCLLMVLFAQY